jgi:hypothetical protein
MDPDDALIGNRGGALSLGHEILPLGIIGHCLCSGLVPHSLIEVRLRGCLCPVGVLVLDE